ncbi:hypothetical protein D3C78_901600 [compost metagenome]
MASVSGPCLDCASRHAFRPQNLAGTVGQAAGTARRLRGSASGIEDLRRPPEDAGRWLADQLGLRRNHGLRHPGIRRSPDPHDRSGYRPRHLLSPPRGVAQPEGRQHLYPAAEPLQRPATFRPVRFVPVRRSGPGIRIRLLDHPAKRTGNLGSAVRRLRQRGPGSCRPVHHQRRAQVGPSVRSDHAAATRL